LCLWFNYIKPDLPDKKHKTVVIDNNKKRKILTLRDTENNKTHFYVYDGMSIKGDTANSNFIEQGDTLVLTTDRYDGKRIYRQNNNVIIGRDHEGEITLYINQDVHNRINQHNKQLALEQEKIREQQRKEQEYQISVTDSLRNEFVNMNKKQRNVAEQNIAEFGNDYQKNALAVIQNEEEQKRINDSIQLAKQIAEQQRIAAEKKAEHERILAEKQRKFKQAQEIRQHKRNGTLWQYITENDTTLIDTVRIVRVYSEKRFDLGGDISYSSSHSGSQHGGGGGGAIIGGIGGGHINPIEGQSSGSASGRGQISANYKSANAVVAQDRYGYTYTLPVDPMMDLRKGDKIVIEYMGRRITETGYFDIVKMLQVMYQNQR
jgi:hypothetical protein